VFKVTFNAGLRKILVDMKYKCWLLPSTSL